MRLSSPVFVSGHTRSGTNLLMRLIDGAPNILVPPGEGKLNVLRRLHGLTYPLEGSAAHVAEIIWNNIELNLDDAREREFRRVLHAQYGQDSGPRGFIDAVSDLLAAVERFVEPGNTGVARRWMEKNHNLEFYWNRAVFLFGRPKLLFVLRNPFDNWLSWRQYMTSNGLGSSVEIFAGIMRQHFANELAEAAQGATPHAGMEAMAAKYGFRATGRASAELAFSGDASQSLAFDPMLMPGADTPEGRFAWNYRLMYERAQALRERSTDVHIVRYEDIVLDTAQAMRAVMHFLGCEWSAVHLTPTDHGRAWGGNSSFQSATGVVDPKTVGRGISTLPASEVEAMRSVLADVPGVDLETAAKNT